MEEERAKKILLMQISVGVITTLVIIFWFFNFQNVWRNNKLQSQNSEEAQKWDELKKDIDDSLGGVQDRLDDLEEKNNLNDEANVLLEEVMQKAETFASSTVATSSLPELMASSTDVTTSPLVNEQNDKIISENACPSYINCMPTIDEVRSCQIPAGCEGITQIAY